MKIRQDVDLWEEWLDLLRKVWLKWKLFKIKNTQIVSSHK